MASRPHAQEARGATHIDTSGHNTHAAGSSDDARCQYY
jgi:hypothetical protein